MVSTLLAQGPGVLRSALLRRVPNRARCGARRHQFRRIAVHTLRDGWPKLGVLQ